RDVIRHCGPDFMRLRLGVGHPGDKEQVTGHVLGRGSGDVDAALDRNIDEALGILPTLQSDGLQAAMKALHTKDD
ncbi:MAG: aminoacyl-tRNA hydrolase, partial [Woeseiaceae bacterium]